MRKRWIERGQKRRGHMFDVVWCGVAWCGVEWCGMVCPFTCLARVLACASELVNELARISTRLMV